MIYQEFIWSVDGFNLNTDPSEGATDTMLLYALTALVNITYVSFHTIYSI